MLKALIQKFLIGRHRQTNVSGFTLIELLVSIIIVSIIIGTLLTFLVNILERDRTEQAKVEAQEESQSALNFIADDMTEAVYIYDADGLYKNQTVNGVSSNILSQLPHNFNTGSGCKANNCTPIIVFWKRYTYDRDDTVKGGNSTTKNRAVRCLQEPSQTASTCIGGNQFVYSLVAYYLLKDGNPNWSSSSRIVRWEIKDGIPWACRENTTLELASAASCPITTGTGASSQKATFNGKDYAVLPDPGFTRFDLSGAGTLSERMNRWRPVTANYDLTINPFEELIDYVDDTPYVAAHDDGVAGNAPAGARIDIDITKNNPAANITTIPPVPFNISCDNPDIGVGVGLLTAQLATTAQTIFSQRIPGDFGDTTQNPIGLSSFYACVNASRVSARVYLRSNALARLKGNITNRPVTDSVFASFLPTSSVRVFGRGVLSIQ